jgi:hypothetical protein
MTVELGFPEPECLKMRGSVLKWSDIDLGRLWILKLEGKGWLVGDLRQKSEADSFDPDDYFIFIDGESVVSHRNVGEWVSDCASQSIDRPTIPRFIELLRESFSDGLAWG